MLSRGHGGTGKPLKRMAMHSSAPPRLCEKKGFRPERPECSRGGAEARRKPDKELFPPSPYLGVPVRDRGSDSGGHDLSREAAKTRRPPIQCFSWRLRALARVPGLCSGRKPMLSRGHGGTGKPLKRMAMHSSASPRLCERTGVFVRKDPDVLAEPQRRGETPVEAASAFPVAP
jgi:hypothetical protein